MTKLLLAPGPVEIAPNICKIASEPLPYFRGKIFAEDMIKLTEDLKYIFQTEGTPITLASSGSGAMEMALQNLFEENDTVAVINGGAFGEKWIKMCEAYRINVIEIYLEAGTLPDLNKIEYILSKEKVKGLLINMHETSTGVLYDIEALGKITHQKDKLFVVDGISAIGADKFMMDKWHCDCAMVSSNKALACMPGLSFIVFSSKAIKLIKTNCRPKYYFDAMDYLKNIPRGMTPFTPAMNVIFQVKTKIEEIKEIGIEAYNMQHENLANHLRKKIIKIPRLRLFGERKSNALSTIILPKGISSIELIQHFREKKHIELAPIPLDRDDLVRVSHMGHINKNHMDKFVDIINTYVNAYSN